MSLERQSQPVDYVWFLPDAEHRKRPTLGPVSGLSQKWTVFGTTDDWLPSISEAASVAPTDSTRRNEGMDRMNGITTNGF